MERPPSSIHCINACSIFRVTKQFPRIIKFPSQLVAHIFAYITAASGKVLLGVLSSRRQGPLSPKGFMSRRILKTGQQRHLEQKQEMENIVDLQKFPGQNRA
jgi:hypothetical protein